MRACLSVRGLSFIALCVAIVGAFGCNASPTEPGAVIDSAIVAKSHPLDTAATSAESAEASEPTAEDAEAAETDDVDADGVNSDEDAVIDENSLPTNTATAAATRTVALSGVIKDRNGKKIAGVSVKIAGKRLDTSDSRGRFSINVRPGRTVTITFSKTGYNNASVTEVVKRARSNISVRLTAAPAAALSSLSLSGSNVPIGTIVNALVTLTKEAPSNGATVMLSSSSPAADVQTSVKIQAGRKSASFKVTAESAGTATITAKYGTKSVKATLTVIGKPEPPDKVVAKFTVVYGSDGKCAIVENPNAPPPLIAACTFDASSSTAPPGSKYTWTFPGSNVFPDRTSATFSNVPLVCGSLPNGVLLERTVILTVTSPGNVTNTYPLEVKFKKSGLC